MIKNVVACLSAELAFKYLIEKFGYTERIYSHSVILCYIAVNLLYLFGIRFVSSGANIHDETVLIIQYLFSFILYKFQVLTRTHTIALLLVAFYEMSQIENGSFLHHFVFTAVCFGILNFILRAFFDNTKGSNLFYFFQAVLFSLVCLHDVYFIHRINWYCILTLFVVPHINLFPHNHLYVPDDIIQAKKMIMLTKMQNDVLKQINGFIACNNKDNLMITNKVPEADLLCFDISESHTRVESVFL